jgi:EREBP-like factor
VQPRLRSNYYGVRFRPDLCKWVAEIRVAEWKGVDKKFWLGTFDTEVAAARGVDLARKLVKCGKKHQFNLPCPELDVYSVEIPSHLDLTDIANVSMFKDVVLFIKKEARAYAASFEEAQKV